MNNVLQQENNQNTFKAPVLYVDHGSPQRILEDSQINTQLSLLWDELNKDIQWIIFVSAHNLSSWKTYISNSDNIEILYDFSWFPDQLYEIKYDLKWDRILSNKLHKDIQWSELTDTIKDDHWIWSVLKLLFPQADKNISIITIDMQLQSSDYFAIWNILKKYREEWYMIIASWSILHNFSYLDFHSHSAQKWAVDFNRDFLSKVKNKQFWEIVQYQNINNISKAFTSKDHFVPILYALWAVDNNDNVDILNDEITMWSLSNNLIIFWDYK